MPYRLRPFVLPARDLAELRRDEVLPNVMAALAVAFLAVPQGIAYALIAGIPPVMGLYAATLPTVVGSLMRSSRHVVTGPTNAVSLLVGAAVVARPDLDPAAMAVTLAFMVAGLQIAGGLLRLGMLVDFISHPVVVGYITGAGVLIMVGQLPNITATPGGHGDVFHKVSVWIEGVHAADPVSVAMALGTAAAILVLRRVHDRLPAAIIAMGGAIGVTMVFGLDARLGTIADLSPIQAGLPPLTGPDLSLVRELWPVAVAVALISVVESSSVARSIASRTGQRLDLSVEFTGEGLANLVSSLMGGYPTTGSLSRSALNEREGATSRLAGMLSGVFVMVAVFLLAPLLNHTPIAALAGLLLVVAWGLIDWAHIRVLLRSHDGDRFAFLATVAGAAWELDKAIYLGVGISLVMFLRRARLIAVRDLAWDNRGFIREFSALRRQRDAQGRYVQEGARYCHKVHVLNIAGSLFFGSAGQLEAAIDEALDHPELEVLVLRLKRAHNFDLSTVSVLVDTAHAMRAEGRRLVIVGLRPGPQGYLERVGAIDEIGSDAIFAREDGTWFAALEHALEEARSLTADHHDQDCPLCRWLVRREQD